MNKVVRICSLLLLSCMAYDMHAQELFEKLQQENRIEFCFDTFLAMIWQELNAIEPYIDSQNGYVELLKKVNEQLIAQGTHINLSENEFFKEVWQDKEVQDVFKLSIEKPQLLADAFRWKWRDRIRKKLGEKTPIKYIKHQGESVPDLIKKRLEANAMIDADDLNNQKQLLAAKQAMYAELEIEKKICGNQQG